MLLMELGCILAKEDELTELDLVKQYDQFARLMAQIPKSI